MSLTPAQRVEILNKHYGSLERKRIENFVSLTNDLFFTRNESQSLFVPSSHDSPLSMTYTSKVSKAALESSLSQYIEEYEALVKEYPQYEEASKGIRILPAEIISNIKNSTESDVVVSTVDVDYAELFRYDINYLSHATR
jgi:hypothetical protein